MGKSIMWFDVNDVIKDCEENIKMYDDKINTLTSIKVLTKKDGKPFANLSKNFEGMTITEYGFSANGFAFYGNDLETVDDYCLYIKILIEKLLKAKKGYKKALESIKSGNNELINAIINLKVLFHTQTEDSLSTKGEYDEKYAMHYLLWNYMN